MSLAEKIEEYNTRLNKLHDEVRTFLELVIEARKKKIKVQLAVLNPYETYASPIAINWVSKDGAMATEEDDDPIKFHFLPTQDLLYMLEEIKESGEQEKTKQGGKV